jgi:hypothetical protein
MLFRVCKIENTYLICSRNGRILRFDKRFKKWSVCNGSIHKKSGYLQMGIDDKKYLLHRIIAYAFKILDLHSPLLIDHIDRNKSNNCIYNLRPATHQQNSFNTNAKGYSQCRQKWRAYIRFNDKLIHLGYFDNEVDARNAYLEAKKKYHIL